MKKITCMALCVTLLASMIVMPETSAKGEEVKEIKSVLFIGNSMTYYNTLCKVVQGLARRTGHEIEVEAVTNGGKNIIYHSTDEKILNAIKKGGYDVVVLQDIVGSFDAQKLQDGAEAIVPIIKQYNPDASIIFYEPWPTKYTIEKPDSYLPYFTQSYLMTAGCFKADVAPVGEAFYDLYVNYKKDYYCSDGKHPQPLGTFLAASTIYFTMYKDSVFREFKSNEQKTLDNLINDNVDYTTEGKKSTYPLDELNLIYSLAYKYAKAVEGPYTSLAWEYDDVLKTISVGKVKIKKAVKKKKTIKITLKKNKKISGYNVQVSKSKKFKKIILKKTIKTKKAIKKGIISIKSKKFKSKKLYVRVRAFVLDANIKYYSTWSKAKKVKA